MNKITLPYKDAINGIKKLKEAHPNDKLEFDVKIQDCL